MPPKKERKILASEEVLKDIQKFLDEKDNESISDEDVNLDGLYDIYIVYEIIRSLTLMVIETVI